MTTVVDSFGPHAGAEIRARGAAGTVRYLAPTPNPKVITKAEYDSLLADGIQVALNWERGTSDYMGGYNAGAVAGTQARAEAHALGHPDSRPIYVSIDTDISPSTLPLALAYVRGFHAAAGATAVYGTAFLIDAAVNDGCALFGWQSCSRGFHDNQRTSAHAALLQHCGDPTFDFNDVLQPDWGQMPAPSQAPHVPPAPHEPPAPPVVVHLQGDNVKLTEVRIKTDENGDGWQPVGPFNTFVAATPQGSYPPVDGYWPCPRVAAQNRDGKALVTVQEGPKNSSVVVLVASTA